MTGILTNAGNVKTFTQEECHVRMKAEMGDAAISQGTPQRLMANHQTPGEMHGPIPFTALT